MSCSKLAAIAGYGSGISAAVARRFAAEGYSIALLGLAQAPLDAAAAGERSCGPAALVPTPTGKQQAATAVAPAVGSALQLLLV
jgi:NAD(P)-dependent dehydrogenase (short-subunit alcohol dehydrogenase family)